MRFASDFSRLLNVPSVAFAGAIMLATVSACSDSSGIGEAVNTDVPPAGVTVLEWPIDEAIKNAALSGSSLGIAGMGQLSSASMAPASAAAASSAAPLYTVSPVPFAPEAAPTVNAGPNCDDCLWVGNPIGFNFVFYGKTYDKINIGSNGIVGFGVGTMRDGCCDGSPIPLNDVNNNIIALGQSDWMPNAVAKAIRYETRGAAPNRRFVLQFTNVPEYGGNGRLTVQLVLSEGTNAITVYTSKLSSTVPNRVFTQGAENLLGSEAAFISGRVRKTFTLTDDAVRYAAVNPNQAPSVVAPSNIVANTGSGACAASVSVGTAVPSDDAAGVKLSSARSDGLALDAAYPKGVTTITWTATDVEGLTASAAQTVTVKDEQLPSITAPANIDVNNDAGLATSSVKAGTPAASDNCPDVRIFASRSDHLTINEPFRVGVTTIVWTAIDGSFNNATAQQTVTVRDIEAPKVTVPASFAVNATSSNGAVVTYAASYSDNVGVASFSCGRPSGTLFPIGPSIVSCEALDAAGNRGSASFTVTVRGASEQIAGLIELVQDVPMSGGARQSLLAGLRTVQRNPGSNNPHVACVKLEDFLRALSQNKASDIAPADLIRLRDAALQIMDVLGCGPSSKGLELRALGSGPSTVQD